MAFRLKIRFVLVRPQIIGITLRKVYPSPQFYKKTTEYQGLILNNLNAGSKFLATQRVFFLPSDVQRFAGKPCATEPR